MLINKTSAVPSGTPLPSNDWITRITPAWLAYKGGIGTQNGTVNKGKSIIAGIEEPEKWL